MAQFNHFLPHNRGFQLAIGVVLGFAVYFLILVGIGELTRRDVRQIGASVGFPTWMYSWVVRICWRESAPDLLPADMRRARGLRPTEFPETFSGTTELPQLAEVPEESAPPPNG
jgi:hypothetical protein